MSGGGKTVLRGRMGQSIAITSTVVSPRKLEQMEQKQQQLETHVRQLCTRQVSLEDQVSKLSEQLKTMKMNLNKYRLEIQVCSCPLIFFMLQNLWQSNFLFRYVRAVY